MAGNTDNTPIPDAELAELRRLHAAANGSPRDYSAPVMRSAMALYEAFPRLLARLEEKEFQLSIQTASASMRGRSLLEAYKHIDQLQGRLEAAERERDELREELAYIKQQLEWVEENGDTYQKSALMDLIRRTLHGLSHTAAIKEAIAARDAKQRRDGAAQVWDIIAERSKLVGDSAGGTYATQSAKRLREGGE